MTGLELLLSLGLLCAFAGAAVLSPWFTRLEREKDAAVQRSFAMEVAVLLGLSDAAPDAGRVSGTYRGHPLTVRVVAYVTHGPAFPMGRTVAADVTIGPSVPEEAPAWAIRPAFEEHTYGPPDIPTFVTPRGARIFVVGSPPPSLLADAAERIDALPRELVAWHPRRLVVRLTGTERIRHTDSYDRVIDAFDRAGAGE